MFDIENFLSLEGYSNSRLERRKGKNATNEFFTPYSIVKRMCDKVSEEDWADPTKTWLEPCFGSGQFAIYIIWKRIQYGIHWKVALETLWGIELMEDNVAECKDRICEMLTNICEDFNEDEARLIMDSQLVCHDFFTWDFENWREYTEEELKKKTKKNIHKKDE